MFFTLKDIFCRCSLPPTDFFTSIDILLDVFLPSKDILFDVLYPLKISYSMIYTLNRYLIRCSSVLKRYYIRWSKSSRDILFDFLYSQVIFLYPQWMFKSVFYTSVCVLYPKQIYLYIHYPTDCDIPVTGILIVFFILKNL